jgi:hypothetical protein
MPSNIRAVRQGHHSVCLSGTGNQPTSGFTLRYSDLTDGEQVGGVRYHAMVPETLEQLISNHRMVVVRGVRRRGDIEHWNYGSMTGSGPRQAKGGIPGDVYGPYACHKGNTVDDIRALFRHALVSNSLTSPHIYST